MTVQERAELIDSAFRKLSIAELAAIAIQDNPRQCDENITRAHAIQRNILRAQSEIREAIFSIESPDDLRGAIDVLQRHEAHLGARAE